MSAYGPALIITPNDEAAFELLPDALARLRRIAKKLDLRDDQGAPVALEVMDEEDDAWQVLFYASDVYGHMPDEIRESEDADWSETAQRLIRELDEAFPDTFEVEAYFIEA